MEYEKTILKLMERIARLEERVDALENPQNLKPSRKTYTEMVVNYIEKTIQKSKENGLTNITLTSGGIQKDVGLKNRLPLVCNAMGKCMDEKSEIIYETPSGQSSTLAIKWNF